VLIAPYFGLHWQRQNLHPRRIVVSGFSLSQGKSIEFALDLGVAAQKCLNIDAFRNNVSAAIHIYSHFDKFPQRLTLHRLWVFGPGLILQYP